MRPNLLQPWLLSSALCSFHSNSAGLYAARCRLCQSCRLVCNALHQSCANDTVAQNRTLPDCPAVLCTPSFSAMLRARGLCVEHVRNTGRVSHPVGLARQARRGWTTATRGTTAGRTRRRAGCARRGWRATPRSRPGAKARSPGACQQAPRPPRPWPRRRARCRCVPLCPPLLHTCDRPTCQHSESSFDVLRSELGPGQGSAGGACACQATCACAGPRPVLVCGPVLTPWAGLAAGARCCAASGAHIRQSCPPPQHHAQCGLPSRPDKACPFVKQLVS